MERASVSRLFKDQTTQKTTLMLESVESKEQYKITVPDHRAGILALEGHGLNDRCSLYGIMSECILKLGGALGSVVVELNKSRGVSGKVSLSHGDDVSWIESDVIELVAFALHTQLPIYLNVSNGDPDAKDQQPEPATVPTVFEDALTEILNTGDAQTRHADNIHELPMTREDLRRNERRRDQADE